MKKEKKTRRGEKATQSRSMFPIISGVVAAFIIVLIITGISVVSSVIKKSNADKPITVDVPQFVGQIYNDEMKARIADEGYFNIEIVEEYTDEYESGYIIAQDPEQGSARKVKKDEQLAPVKLTISYGTESVTLRDYSMLEYRTAKLELSKLGIHVEEFGEYDNIALQYYTIRTEPEAGSVLKRGDTVKLFYSLGPEVEYVTVPSFIGMKEGAAIVKLNENGLTYGKITREYSDDYLEGEIVSQSKPSGSKVASGVTEIDFVVSLGSKP